MARFRARAGRHFKNLWHNHCVVWARSSEVERPLGVREAPGSNPGGSTHFLRELFGGNNHAPRYKNVDGEISTMDKPRFAFSPPQPFSSNDLREIIEKLDALEKEILLLKKRISDMERQRPPRPQIGMQEPRPIERLPALLSELDLGNVRVIESLLDWVQFMLSKVGREEYPKLIEYYRDIGWISESVAQILLRYAQGMYVEEFQGYMLPEDHAKSLDYITRIKEAME